MLKVYRFDIHCETITTIKLIDISITLHTCGCVFVCVCVCVCVCVGNAYDLLS